MTNLDPQTPVIVGAAQFTNTDGNAEPIAMMVRVVEAALADSGAGADLRTRVDALRPLKGIWPYQDPAALLQAELGMDGATTGLTPIGGNEAYDLLARSAADITAGAASCVVICAAETMKTRRRDRAAGRTTAYLPERENAAPQQFFGKDVDFTTDVERAAVAGPPSFYAMAETANRLRRQESRADHMARVSALWSKASQVASQNPHAVLQDARTAIEIATVDAGNRMIAYPYPKLMTANVNVDQAAAVIVCSAEVAAAAGVPRDRWVFPQVGTGAADHWLTQTRWALDESPAMRLAGAKALELADVGFDDIDIVDLYSCFPVAVQVAHKELGFDPEREFTITGGLTFNGGPMNSYCMHPLVTAVGRLRSRSGRAFLSGNGGYFTKHSFAVLGSEPPASGYQISRLQDQVDALPARPMPDGTATGGTVESWTVRYSRDGSPERAVLAVLDDAGARHWAVSDDQSVIDHAFAADSAGWSVAFGPGSEATSNVPEAVLV